MRLSEEMKPRYGRKRRQPKKKVSKTYKLRRRIVSRFLVLKGWDAARIADYFNTLHPEQKLNPASVQRWINRGCPLVDAEPKRKKPDAGNGPHHYPCNR